MNNFEKLVFEMRTLQKNYSKTPMTQSALKHRYLNECKEMENLVDQHLRQKRNPLF